MSAMTQAWHNQYLVRGNYFFSDEANVTRLARCSFEHDSWKMLNFTMSTIIITIVFCTRTHEQVTVSHDAGMTQSVSRKRKPYFFSDEANVT